MAANQYILVFDHGTTSIRACLMNRQGLIMGRSQREFEQIYPKPGWVEHNPDTLWEITLDVAEGALAELKTDWEHVAAIGLTNQRETVVMWDKTTGRPVYNAIVWQCRRTADFCHQLKEDGLEETLIEKTGLVVDPYFSASKIRWILDHIPEARPLAEKGHLLFGTVDTWILWQLSGGRLHVTDYTNASRTQLFNIHTRQWDPELLDIFGVPAHILPEVKSSSEIYGHSDPKCTRSEEIAITGIAGDQQAALHGQKCWTPGLAKSTYGTGAFLVMNTGEQPVRSEKGLLTTLACDAEGCPAYALEGAIFIAGGAIEWLTKKLHLIHRPAEIDPLAESVPDNDGVYFIPAFTGLGAPYWNTDARGAIVGLTQDAGKAHIVRAAIEAMAYQTRAVLDAMQTEAGLSLEVLRVDGGVTRSAFLCRFLADLLDVPVARTADPELTAKGAGYLAGLAAGFWSSPDEILKLETQWEQFKPDPAFGGQRERLMREWEAAVCRVL